MDIVQSCPSSSTTGSELARTLGAGCKQHGKLVYSTSIAPPSTLATISGYLTGISSFLSKNIGPTLARATAAAPKQPAVSSDTTIRTSDESTKEEVIFSKFQWIDWSGLQSSRLFLLLGYPHGFQIWDVTDTDTAVEIVSIRDGCEAVVDIEVIPTPWLSHVADPFKSERPLVVFVTKVDKGDHSAYTATIVSLSTNTLIHTIELASCPIAQMRVDANAKYLAFNLGKQLGIRLYSLLDFSLMATYTDVHASPLHDAPVFEIGSRLIAYTTTTKFNPAFSKNYLASPHIQSGSDLETLDLCSGILGTSPLHANASISPSLKCATHPANSGGNTNSAGNSGSGGVNAGEVATKVAKGVASGVKVIGEYGYHAISSYFTGDATSPSFGGVPSRAMAESFGKSNGFGNPVSNSYESRKDRKKDPQDGIIVLRSLPRPFSKGKEHSLKSSPQLDQTQPESSSILSLFHPHTNPVAILKMDPSETRLYTASIEGTSIYVWDISDIYLRRVNSLHIVGTHGGCQPIPRCLFRCDRGYTAAKIDSISQSANGKWISVMTARGTAHVFHTEFGSDTNDTANRDRHDRQTSDGGVQRTFGVKMLTPIVRLNARTSIDVVKHMFTSDSSSGMPGSTGTDYTNTTSLEDHIECDEDQNMSHNKPNFLPPFNLSGCTHISAFLSSDLTYSPGLPSTERQRIVVWDLTGKVTLFWVDLIPEEGLSQRTATLPPAVLTVLNSFPRATFMKSVSLHDGLGATVIKTEYKVLTMPVSSTELQRKNSHEQVWMSDQILEDTESAYSVDSNRRRPSQQKQLWPSRIEISSCSDQRIPLWMDLQCTMQVYHPDLATKTLVTLMTDTSTDQTFTADTDARSSIKPCPSFSDVPLAMNIVVAPYTPTPHGDRKGFPRLDGDSELEQGILSAMGDGMEMPVGQQSLLDAFFIEDDGFNVIKSAHSIPVYERVEYSAGSGGSSIVGTAWGNVQKVFDASARRKSLMSSNVDMESIDDLCILEDGTDEIVVSSSDSAMREGFEPTLTRKEAKRRRKQQLINNHLME
ncbi:Breast carcinoma amplified sequence 3 [Batrachochytrium dendrobatidis]|nr:Breast carcinoma amplified sequence 3 [Batrachochytrium dendrobatidis]KAK5666377.1 Breast carcinoma amplified sequence 3 [Batrachochytrium dendrobatidis]